jgi:hypothetical protein
VRETSLSSARVAVAITELELAALVVPGDGVYRRASEGRVPLGPTA